MDDEFFIGLRNTTANSTPCPSIVRLTPGGTGSAPALTPGPALVSLKPKAVASARHDDKISWESDGDDARSPAPLLALSGRSAGSAGGDDGMEWDDQDELDLPSAPKASPLTLALPAGKAGKPSPPLL
jgi:hypothetical protein